MSFGNSGSLCYFDVNSKLGKGAYLHNVIAYHRHNKIGTYMFRKLLEHSRHRDYKYILFIFEIKNISLFYCSAINYNSVSYSFYDKNRVF